MEEIAIKKSLKDKNSYFSYIYNRKISIPIIYEDNQLVVAVKPAGVLSQSDISGKPDMLTVLKSYIKIKYNKPGEVFLGLLHRLDCPVGGIMVFARTSKAASRISEQIRNRNIEKKYYAVVSGKFKDTSGRIESKLVKGINNTVSESEEGKDATLSYEVIGYNTDFDLSLLDIALETGRTHQIRYQFASIGHPLVGDNKYGASSDRLSDIALFSHNLKFKHPTRVCNINIEVYPDSIVFNKYFPEYSSQK